MLNHREPVQSGRRGEAFRGNGSHEDKVFSGGGRKVVTALVSARKSGNLNLKGCKLTSLPDETFNIASVKLPEGDKWWEMRDALEILDASENELTDLPAAVSLYPG